MLIVNSIMEALKKEKQIINTALDAQRKQILDLNDYDGRILVPSVRKSGRVYYSTVDPASKKRRYLGSEENQDVQNIKAMHHLKLSNKLLEGNSKLISSLIENYSNTDAGYVDLLLPKTYRNGKYELNKAANLKAIKWKEEKEAFKVRYHEKYPEKYPESFVYQRRNGEWMRSKSEGSIADILDINKLTFVYELPHFCDGFWFLSDFTVLSPLDFESEIIIEHAGRMDLEKYRQKYIFSIEHYMKAGYRPNINLFFTFDNLDGTFSEIPVQMIIDNWLLPEKPELKSNTG